MTLRLHIYLAKWNATFPLSHLNTRKSEQKYKNGRIYGLSTPAPPILNATHISDRCVVWKQSFKT